MNEIEQKEQILREYLHLNGYQGILLLRRDTFSWITGGKINHIIRSTEFGMSALFITLDDKYCIANQVERYRMMEEEDLAGLGYSLLETDWWNEDYTGCIRRHFGRVKIAADTDITGADNVYEEIKKLRFSLLPEEIERYRKLCSACTVAVEETCREIRTGDTEHQVCASLVGKVMREGIEASVALVASDCRILRYRHPIDTEKKIEKYAMVVLCGRKYGLIANLTRFVHFGPLPEKIRRKFDLVRKVDAEMITNTVVGKSTSAIFTAAMQAYEEAGYKDEWKLLHQGGPTGYATRDFLATPFYDEVVRNNQAFTWNPSITGTKSEDTFLVNTNGFEVLTDSNNWPTAEVKANNGMTLNRPDVLIR